MTRRIIFVTIISVLSIAISCANDVDKLYEAVEKEDIQQVKELISKGIQVDIEGKEKQPLHIAVEKGNKDIIEILLKAGADINSKTKEEDTPLHITYYKENWEIFNYLVKNGADAKIIIKYKLDSTEKEYSVLMIFKLIHRNMLNELKIIIENNKEIINFRDSENYTLMHIAVLKTNKDFLMYLINKGADLSVRNKDGRTPFELALYNKKIETIRELLNLGAYKYVDGRVFHYLEQLCEREYRKEALEIAETILQKRNDIDLNYKTKEGGYTALHYAALMNQYEYAELLLKYGADPNIKNATGLLPIDITEVLLKSPQFTVEDPDTWQQRADKIKSLLLQYGSKPYRGFKFATVEKGDGVAEDIVAIDYDE